MIGASASSANVSQVCDAFARIIVWTMLLVVALLPFTERFCALDCFPRGGQDCELTILLIISLFGLILLLALRRRASFLPFA
jgi:hypothetical protein